MERRRRENINEGINELAKIVPGCEKNKGSILQQSVAFIQRIKATEKANLDKWSLDKLVAEQAIQELASSVEKLKTEVERAWREAERWKKVAENAGAKPSPGVENANVSSNDSGGDDGPGGDI